MKPIRLTRMAAVVALAAASLSGVAVEGARAAAVGELVVNGSFEAPDVPRGTFLFTNNVPGWTRSAGSSGTVMEIDDHAIGDPAPGAGDQFTELGSDGAIGIYQDVATSPGRTYRLRFIYSPRPNLDPSENVFRARAGDQERAFGPLPTTGVTVWKQASFTFVATGSSSRIEFVDTGPSDHYGPFIDLVSVLDDTAPAVTRYVALGDSIPYGHGIADPRPAHNDPPSRLAYPSLVASQLGLTLNVRSTGCVLSDDQLSVSGAPLAAANVSGQDDDCPNFSPRPHKSVEPDELDAAGIGLVQPALVTIQAGADDIEFVRCFEDLLGLPYVPFLIDPKACVVRQSNQFVLSADTKQRLDQLTFRLRAILEQIEAAAPNAAIAVLNYYQPIPMPTAVLYDNHDSSFFSLCRGMVHSSLTERRDLYLGATVLATALNAAIAKGINGDARVVSVDLFRTFFGKEICTQNGLASEYLFTDTWNAVHPSAAGQRLIADKVVATCGQGCGRRT